MPQICGSMRPSAEIRRLLTEPAAVTCDAGIRRKRRTRADRAFGARPADECQRGQEQWGKRKKWKACCGQIRVDLLMFGVLLVMAVISFFFMLREMQLRDAP